MATTSHPSFNEDTEGFEVAKVFADNIRGKTILITGVNRNGLGFSTAEALASQAPAHLIFASRNPLKIQESIDALKPTYPNIEYHILQMDLSSQTSVRQAAAELLLWNDIPTIDILINNAGTMLTPTRTLTSEGVENHFATNHISHFLFTNLIMPKLILAAKHNPNGATRVINVSAGSPTLATMRWSDRNFNVLNKNLPLEEQPSYAFLKLLGNEHPEEMSYIPFEAYNQSKIANVLFGIGLNKRVFDNYGIFSTAVHPGVIKTEIGRDMDAATEKAVLTMLEKGVFKRKSFGAGGATGLVAALDPKVAVGVGEAREGKENWGAYMSDCGISGAAREGAVSSVEAERLWRLSEELVGEEFGW